MGHHSIDCLRTELVAEIVYRNKIDDVSLLVLFLGDAYGSHRSLLDMLTQEFDEVTVDGEPYSGVRLNPEEKHSITLTLGNLEKETPRHTVREIVQKAKALGSTSITVKTRKSEHSYSTASVCSYCGKWFTELKPQDFHFTITDEAASVTWNGFTITEIQRLSVDTAIEYFKESELAVQAPRLHEEIMKRLTSLKKVGLGYIDLNRPSPTLSRGESQRVRLAVSLTQ